MRASTRNPPPAPSPDRSAARSPQVNAAGHAGSACGNARARFPEGVVVVVFDTRAAQTGPSLPLLGAFTARGWRVKGGLGMRGCGGSMRVFASDLAPAFSFVFLIFSFAFGVDGSSSEGDSPCVRLALPRCLRLSNCTPQPLTTNRSGETVCQLNRTPGLGGLVDG